MSKPNSRKHKVSIYDKYREALKMPELSESEIDEMRKHMQRLARAICEHVWGEDFY